MGMDFKVNEYGEIIRDAETSNDLAAIFEGKLLKRLAMKRFYGCALEILQ